MLDINMPGASGFQVCEAIRTKSRVPVMMLTVRGEEEDLVRALELGADDYLTKPFSPRTLLARIKALLRRAGMESSRRSRSGACALDVEEHTVRVGTATPVRLTKLELRLLQMLLANAGHTVNSDRLLMQVWGHRNRATGSCSSSSCTGCGRRSKSIRRRRSCCRPPRRATSSIVELDASSLPALTRRAGDLVEHAAILEVRGLRLRPAAEVGDGHELQLGKLRGVLRRHLRIARPVEVACAMISWPSLL